MIIFGDGTKNFIGQKHAFAVKFVCAPKPYNLCLLKQHLCGITTSVLDSTTVIILRAKYLLYFLQQEFL